MRPFQWLTRCPNVLEGKEAGAVGCQVSLQFGLYHFFSLVAHPGRLEAITGLGLVVVSTYMVELNSGRGRSWEIHPPYQSLDKAEMWKEEGSDPLLVEPPTLDTLLLTSAWKSCQSPSARTPVLASIRNQVHPSSPGQ